MRVLVTGASGQLGTYLLDRLLEQPHVTCVAWSGRAAPARRSIPLQPVELTDEGQLATAWAAARPDVVLHTAAISSVGVCHAEPERAAAVNTHATRRLANLAAAAGVRLIYTSTDLVFDGRGSWYSEQHEAEPLSVYGRTKREAEKAVLAHPEHTVVRISLLFGPARNGRQAFFDQQRNAIASRQPLQLFRDEWRTPLDLATAANELARLAASDVSGLLHLGGPQRMTRLEMGQRLAEFLGFDSTYLVPVDQANAQAAEPRPRDVSLDSSRWRVLFPHAHFPSWEEALMQMLPRG